MIFSRGCGTRFRGDLGLGTLLRSVSVNLAELRRAPAAGELLGLFGVDDGEGEDSGAGLDGGEGEEGGAHSVVAFHPAEKFGGD